MAYSFDGTNQYVSGADVGIGYPSTMFMRSATLKTEGYASFFTRGNSTDNDMRMTLGQSSLVFEPMTRWTSSANQQFSVGTTDITGGAYFALTAIFQVNRLESYTDNSAGSVSTADLTNHPTLHLLGIGALMRSIPSAFMWGSAAECAIWSAILTAAEIASLAKGFSPRRIRPQSLVFHAPLIRNLQDVRRGLALTPVNSPTVAVHPRCYA